MFTRKTNRVFSPRISLEYTGESSELQCKSANIYRVEISKRLFSFLYINIIMDTIIIAVVIVFAVINGQKSPTKKM